MEFLDQVVQKIVDFLHEKDVEISKEELIEVLNASPEVPDNSGCIYTPNIGKNKGIPCGEPTVAGYDYCKTCLERKIVRKKLGLEIKETKKTTTKKTTTKKETKTPIKFNFSGANKELVDKKAIKHKLEPIDKNGYYYFPEENFIVRKEPNGTYLVTGFGEKEVERPLSAKEKKKALSLGFRVLEDVEEDEE